MSSYNAIISKLSILKDKTLASARTFPIEKPTGTNRKSFRYVRMTGLPPTPDNLGAPH
ncbi:MAG TPA: hypothetical protein PLG55_09735 [Methanospirillum sp.]|uniref:hypothetical protein n=1 Tax=Methanospirillum sp. TaxID=45200 RepID=UPI001BD6C23A|nr:hypothetical protein [Methanospirillum sp.]HPY60989.1 hypothetical protein [Methanospirillum sp.]HQB99003.1 hypothetical protein [Methanospirillum sp.]